MERLFVCRGHSVIVCSVFVGVGIITMNKLIQILKLCVLFALIAAVGTILHELVHVIQFKLIYGSNITFLEIQFFKNGMFAYTRIIHTGTTFLDFMSPTARFLFLEIPAYLVTLFVFIISYAATNFCCIIMDIFGKREVKK